MCLSQQCEHRLPVPVNGTRYAGGDVIAQYDWPIIMSLSYAYECVQGRRGRGCQHANRAFKSIETETPPPPVVNSLWNQTVTGLLTLYVLLSISAGSNNSRPSWEGYRTNAADYSCWFVLMWVNGSEPSDAHSWLMWSREFYSCFMDGKNLLSNKIISVTDGVSAAFTKLPFYARNDTLLFLYMIQLVQH